MEEPDGAVHGKSIFGHDLEMVTAHINSSATCFIRHIQCKIQNNIVAALSQIFSVRTHLFRWMETGEELQASVKCCYKARRKLLRTEGKRRRYNRPGMEKRKSRTSYHHRRMEKRFKVKMSPKCQESNHQRKNLRCKIYHFIYNTSRRAIKNIF